MKSTITFYECKEMDFSHKCEQPRYTDVTVFKMVLESHGYTRTFDVPDIWDFVYYLTYGKVVDFIKEYGANVDYELVKDGFWCNGQWYSKKDIHPV